MKFKKSYETWMMQHRNLRSGERLAQLDRRDHHGEILLLQNVLIPTLGSFTHLQPEYELNILGARTMFLDIAYVNPPLLIDFERDGYDYHANKISREQFAYERKRDIMLKLEGWQVLRFAYDDVKENPVHLRQLVRRFMEKFESQPSKLALFDFHEREIIRMALFTETASVRMKHIIIQLEIGPNKARAIMKKLVNEGVFLIDDANLQRIQTYKLNQTNDRVRKWVS
jgi:hypothetical protein